MIARPFDPEKRQVEYVGGPSQRMLGQQGGRAGRHHPIREQFGVVAEVMHLDAVGDAEIDLIFAQSRLDFFADQAHVRARMARLPIQELWRDPFAGKRRQAGYGQRRVRPRPFDDILGVTNPIEAERNGRVVDAPPGGHGDASAAPLQQSQAQGLLGLADLLADRAHGNAKLGRGLRHAATPAESLEGLYRAQGGRVLHLGNVLVSIWFSFPKIERRCKSYVPASRRDTHSDCRAIQGGTPCFFEIAGTSPHGTMKSAAS